MDVNDTKAMELGAAVDRKKGRQIDGCSIYGTSS